MQLSKNMVPIVFKCRVLTHKHNWWRKDLYLHQEDEGIVTAKVLMQGSTLSMKKKLDFGLFLFLSAYESPNLHVSFIKIKKTCWSDDSKYFKVFFERGKVPENLNNVIYDKKGRHLKIEGREPYCSNMMTFVKPIILDFTIRGMEKNNVTNKLQELAPKPLLFGQSGH